MLPRSRAPGQRAVASGVYGAAILVYNAHVSYNSVPGGPAGPPGESSLVDRFNLLHKSGALDDLAFLRRENRELDRLINDASALMSLTSVPEMLDFVLSRLLDHFIPEFLAFLIKPPRGELLRQYCYRNLKRSDERVPDRYYELIKRHFDASPFPVRFDELRGNSAPGTWGREFLSFSPAFLYPMRSIGGLYGVVLLGTKVLGGEYTELERLYVDRMTRFLAVGIQNGLHHESSITDPKTGLYNHDYFMRRLEEEQARIQRHGGRAGIIIMDVDHFKAFNDLHGHVTGDEALSALADTLRAVTRDEDTVARFGGEEFCVLALDCGETRLLEIAERIRLAVESLALPHDGRELRITISLGARSFGPGEACGSVRLLADADKALYESKSSGRNRSTLFATGLLRLAASVRAASARTGQG